MTDAAILSAFFFFKVMYVAKVGKDLKELTSSKLLGAAMVLT